MRRMLIAAAVVLCCSALQAGPGDAEFANWQSNWQDANGFLVFPNPTGTPYGYVPYQDQAYGELYFISIMYTGTPAAYKADVLMGHWGMWKRR